jgi:hypothetical protein
MDIYQSQDLQAAHKSPLLLIGTDALLATEDTVH